MITAKVYDAASPSTLITELTQRAEPNWLEQFNETGSGSVKIHERDIDLSAYPEILNYDNIIRFSLDGVERFAFIVEARSKPPAPRNEWAGRWWELTGRGVLAILQDAIVYPEIPFDETLVTDRTFGYMAMAFDDSDWVTATEIQQQSATGPIGAYVGQPGGWPDPTAFFIWSSATDSDGMSPVGTSYFRKSFNLEYDTFVALCATGDNRLRLWMDDELIFDDLTDPQAAWRDMMRQDRTLYAGDHLLAAEVYNDFPTVGANPGGLLVSVMQIDAAHRFTGTVIVNTDDTWLALDYPSDPPGMTVGTILRILVEEAQARGALSGLTLGFDDASDSNAAYWDVVPDQAFEIGTNLLDVVRTFVEAFIDVEMTPDLVLNAYNKGTLGSDLTGSVSLQIGQDFEELGASGSGESIGDTHVCNVMLARDQTGALSEHEDTSSVAVLKRKESYLSMGTAPSTTQAARAAQGVFVDFALPSAQLSGKVVASCGPYTTWSVGDIITAPDMFGAPAYTTVLSIGVSEDEAGNPLYSVELAQDDMELTS